MELVKTSQSFTFRPTAGTMMKTASGFKEWPVSTVTVNVSDGKVAGAVVEGPSGTGRSLVFHMIQIDALPAGHFVKEAVARVMATL